MIFSLHLLVLEIQQGGQLYTVCLFCRPDDALPFVKLLLGGCAAPDCDGVDDDSICAGCIELHHQLLRHVVLLLDSLSDGANFTVPF